MVSIKEAVLAAKKFVEEVYAQSGEQISEIGLEEVDRSEDESVWLITIGFTTTDKTRKRALLEQSVGTVLGGLATLTRDYKVVHIDRKTGEPLLMKMRQFRS